MKYSAEQLEFCFEDALINNIEKTPIAKSEIFSTNKPIFKETCSVIEKLKQEPEINEISIEDIGRKVKINVVYSNKKTKSFYALHAIQNANDDEFEIIKKFFTQKISSPAIFRPVVKKYLISRVCHCKLNWISDGRFHSLNYFFDNLNQKYFLGELSNNIYWFQKKKLPVRRRMGNICLGFFCKGCCQIFINPKLDTDKIPNSVLEVVVYHEMVHAYLFNKNPISEKSHGKKFKELFYLHPEARDVDKFLKSSTFLKIWRILTKEANH